ncbi:MAG TPA: hypothetical protein VNZ50_06955 [Hyphomicrobiaceae bacterium]|nr:hypothetical protein [Hyphomicrobiaceae bacterium]
MHRLPEPPQHRYEALLRHYFQRLPTAARGADCAQHFHCPEFVARTDELAPLFAHVMQHAARDLAVFDNDQLGIGLTGLFSMRWSNFGYRLANSPAHRQNCETVPVAEQAAAIASIEVLYADCLAPRAVPAAGLPHDAAGPLGAFTYMVWDASPLGYWRGAGPKDPRVAALLEVLAAALSLPNAVCIKSALHGLGHLEGAAADARRAIVEDFLAKRGADLDAGLARYAAAAARGAI